jgi:transposase-like protein
VDQDGEVIDVYLQARRDGAAAKRFFKRLPLYTNVDEKRQHSTGNYAWIVFLVGAKMELLLYYSL